MTVCILCEKPSVAASGELDKMAERPGNEVAVT